MGAHGVQDPKSSISNTSNHCMLLSIFHKYTVCILVNLPLIPRVSLWLLSLLYYCYYCYTFITWNFILIIKMSVWYDWYVYYLLCYIQRILKMTDMYTIWMNMVYKVRGGRTLTSLGGQDLITHPVWIWVERNQLGYSKITMSASVDIGQVILSQSSIY